VTRPPFPLASGKQRVSLVVDWKLQAAQAFVSSHLQHDRLGKFHRSFGPSESHHVHRIYVDAFPFVRLRVNRCTSFAS